MGVLYFERDPTNLRSITKYKDVYHLDKIQILISERDHPPLELNPDHQVILS